MFDIKSKNEPKRPVGRPKKYENGKTIASFTLDRLLDRDLVEYCKKIGYNKSEYIQMLVKSSIYRSQKNS